MDSDELEIAATAVEPITASVIIPAYSMARWDQLVKAVGSLQVQTRAPLEVIVCIDHNEELLELSRAAWEGQPLTVPVVVVANRFAQDHLAPTAHVRAHGSKRRFGAGWARNTAAEIALGSVLVFLDDDAWAEPDWLEHLLPPFEDPAIAAVGGAPLPEYQTGRPNWFPANFDWIFGCAYEGMPTSLEPLEHLIGANMSVRHSDFNAIGGFHSIDFDDLDLCMRVAKVRPDAVVLYEPKAVVHHFVPADRVTWTYFWKRCFYVNREKVEAFEDMGDAANLSAELAFVQRALTVQSARALRSMVKGNTYALQQLGAMIIGIALAGIGHIAGKVQQRALRRSNARNST